jgi:hypothetical protein
MSSLVLLKAALQEQAPVRAARPLGVVPGSNPALPLHAGQLVEVLGSGRWAFGVRLLREHPDAHAAWITTGELPVFPVAIEQEGVSLNRILFIERAPPEEGLEILLNVLRSRLFEWVLLEPSLLPKYRQDVQIRKIQLAAEECGSGILLLSGAPTPSFGVQIRIETGGASGMRIGKAKRGISG